jgi:hypothetical protein
MKYHNHIIKKVYDASIGEDMNKDQSYYEIYDKNNNFINSTLCLGCAKDYIDSGYNETYLV